MTGESAELQTFRSLSQSLLSEQSLDATLRQVARLTKELLPGCDSAGASIAAEGKLTTLGATDDFTLATDRDQYEANEGPCLDSLRSGKRTVISDLSKEDRWPRWRERAVKKGLRSSLSLPLHVQGKTLGALNLYSRSSNSFGSEAQEVAQLLSSQASIVLANAQLYEQSQKLSEDLEQALETRGLIGEAKGIIMEREKCSAAEAFEMLKKISQNANVKLRDVAAEVVSRVDSSRD